ncbi:histone deacetylase 6/10 [Cladophialophora yegresii CBS 114405]|uniref:histone deacetylase n=1 Tax=Cladophialophora yegresii CBS 114405 TaxID=1182544 RepID=W9VIA4_9EURO|nr:histone deacetylase 6/10 [Cladophialophora yegresii CBS 114405]EXJ55243.1 histone deacetylase 6/10 [Cladophialophora yegresii CBS 114405]
MAPNPPSPPRGFPQAANGPRFANPFPQLPEQALLSEDISMRETPDMSGDINSRLRIESPSDDTSEDSLMSDSDSEPDETLTKSRRGLPISTLPTGLCYDDRMRYHAEVAATSAENVHPEDPRRIYYIFKELCEAGLVDDKDYPPMVEQPLRRIDAREATKEEILLIHDEEDHYKFVRSTAAMTNAELIDLSESAEQDSIYFNQLSFFSGKLSAGAAIETCKAVLDRKVKNAIAVIRPPGHHAEPLKPMGFCLFNNVCIASKACQVDAILGQECRKILIVDWDVHHGNGCQRAFYNDPNILYISLHVHMNGQFYPSGPEGDMFHCGEGPGLGKNVNIPWPSKGMGDGDYIYAFQSVVMPIAVEFDPDFVIVAAGFDAAAGDELGGCFVTPACYAHMTHMLMSLAGGKIAVCLEGGYNFGAISKSALAVTRTLMGEPPDRLQATAATSSAIDTIAKVRNVQSKYWRSIYPKEPVAGIFGGERLHDIIRRYQAMHLYDKYKLTQLHIFRDTITRSFDQQVLATPNYETKKALIVIFHDSPDLLASNTGISTQQKPHDTWLVDGTQSYIHWATSQNHGVIDVNIPEFITVPAPAPAPALPADQPGIKPEQQYGTAGLLDPASAATSTQHQYSTSTSVEYASGTSDLARREGEKLASYLWENYIEPYAFPHGIFLVGAGHAFHSVAKLISDNDTVYPALSGVVVFSSTQPIRPVTSGTNHWVTGWYRENSLVYVSEKHSLWKKEKEKQGGKVFSKRYGRLVKSPAEVLNGMMLLHREEVVRWMTERIEQRREAMGSSEEEGEDDDDNEEDDGEEDSTKADADGDNDADAAKNGQASSDADTIDDPAVKGESGNGDGGGIVVSAAGASPLTGAPLSRGDVVMTTEQ